MSSRCAPKRGMRLNPESRNVRRRLKRGNVGGERDDRRAGSHQVGNRHSAQLDDPFEHRAGRFGQFGFQLGGGFACGVDFDLDARRSRRSAVDRSAGASIGRFL